MNKVCEIHVQSNLTVLSSKPNTIMLESLQVNGNLIFMKSRKLKDFFEGKQ